MTDEHHALNHHAGDMEHSPQDEAGEEQNAPVVEPSPVASQDDSRPDPSSEEPGTEDGDRDTGGDGPKQPLSDDPKEPDFTDASPLEIGPDNVSEAPEKWSPIAYLKGESVLNLNVHSQTDISLPSDPTQPLVHPTLQQRPVGGVITGMVTEKARCLWNEGVMLITCAHELLLQSSSLLIAHEPFFYRLQRRILDLGFADDNQSLETLLNKNALLNIGETAPGKKDGGKNAVIFVDIQEEKSFRFFEKHLHRFSRNRFWRESNLYYLFRISGQALLGSDYAELVFSKIPRWDIDALSVTIDDFVGKSDDTTTDELVALKRELREGARSGLWPNEEEDLLREVEAVINGGSGGLEELKKEIAARRGQPQQIADNARQIFREANPAERAALFTAIYFSECPFHQYDQVLNTLLTGDEIEVTTTEEIINPQTGEKITQKNTSRMKANEWWHKFEENSMERMGMEFYRHRKGHTFISFSHPAMRRGFDTVIPPRMATKFFEKLYQQNLLFLPNTPKQILDSLCKLTVDMFEKYSDKYNEIWLMNRLLEIIGNLYYFAKIAGIKLQFDNDPEPGDLSSLFQYLETNWKPYYDHLFYQTAQICREFLHKPDSAKVAHAFIKQLIMETQPNCLTVLGIIKRLRVSFEIDQLFSLLLHLLKVGNTATCRGVTGLLLEIMEQAPELYWSVLQKITQWHPPYDIDQSQPLSNSDHWSLVFLYIVWDEQRLLKGKNIEMPPPAIFSKNEIEGSPLYQERMALLAQWLTHPRFNDSIRTVMKKINPDMYHMIVFLVGDDRFVPFCLAQMLEFWNFEYGETSVEMLISLLTKKLTKKALVDLRGIINKFAESTIYFISNEASKNDRAKASERRIMALALSKKLI